MDIYSIFIGIFMGTIIGLTVGLFAAMSAINKASDKFKQMMRHRREAKEWELYEVAWSNSKVKS